MLNKLLLKEIDQIILDRHLVKKHKTKSIESSAICDQDKLNVIQNKKESNIDVKLDPTFAETLFKIIDERCLKDSDIYNKVGIDRKVFSKIRNNTIKVSKNNAIALCIGLKLDIKQMEDLLSKAGYALSKSSIRDVIIRQCIEKNIYDIENIDEYLIHYEQKTIIKY